jgi:glycosyltransferase involved in cell wall biosynthesis
MLGVALSLLPWCRSVFVLFPDKGKSRAFQRHLQDHGLEVVVLSKDSPHIASMAAELARRLRDLGADLLCCHGYKADLIGLLAARRASVPVIALSHGWVAENVKVRIYEAIDRACMRRMDRVICVSEGQATKVRHARVPSHKIAVIRNSIHAERIAGFDPAARAELHAMFPRPPEQVVGAAGRLSPEKGFGALVEAAAIVAHAHPGVGFVHFGDGRLREAVTRRITKLGLGGRFVLAGFRDDLDRFLPHWDLTVIPSFTEGLPTIALESYAAGVPVVATAVGGNPEVVIDGVDGYLVPPGDPSALARRVLDLLEMGESRKEMGRLGQERIRSQFTFQQQSERYRQLFLEILRPRPPIVPGLD